MKLPVKASRCLICCENEANSWGHIIPDCVGGRIEAQLLCTDCKNRYDSTLVSQIKNDPPIQYAVQTLKDEIPDIAKNYKKINHFGEKMVGTSRLISTIRLVVLEVNFILKSRFWTKNSSSQNH